MDMPPSRYRVIERGRRLIVVDTQRGVPVSGLDRNQLERMERLRQRLGANEATSPPSTATPRSTSAVAPVADVDPGILTTQHWFDNKAPRRVRIRQDKQGAMVAFLLALVFVPILAFIFLDWVGLVLIAVALSQKGVRNAIRGVFTKWLDGMEQVRG